MCYPQNISIMVEKSFFSPNGRLRRKHYFLRLILLGIPALILVEISKNPQELSITAGVFVFILSAFVSISAIIQVVKRLHDIGLNGWLWIISLIPIANLIFGLYLLFMDGTKGPNKYGDDPKGRFSTFN